MKGIDEMQYVWCLWHEKSTRELELL